METRIYVDGRITSPEEAVVPVLDHGFLFGDSVYEVLWWHRGALVQEREHLERLEESARRLYMDVPFARAELVDAIRRTCEAAGVGPEEDAYIRLVVTRGAGPLGLGFRRVPRRSLVVIVAPADRPTPEEFERGLKAAVVRRRRNPAQALDPRAKTGNYLNNVLALHEAQLAGADDALMLNEQGEVTEATTSNVYLVIDGALVTPPLEAGILKGTTRTRILELCGRLGIEAHERTVRPEDLKAAREIFVSSSVRGVLPIVEVDGVPVADGSPGPLTRRLHDAFEAAAGEEARRAAHNVQGMGAEGAPRAESRGGTSPSRDTASS